ncbi:DUF6524 family protein [Roseovarius sp. CH_XMU1461]|uniref:DUF6524 family protein n=1 Tax=Roseovarius sp. CH_XMU1461 TaxID=3107777 RepID=UPI003007F7D9
MAGFFLRWFLAFALLAVTFNPTGYSYLGWARDNLNAELPMVVLGGLLLLVGYIIYLRATLRSIGGFGMLLVLAIAGALVWVLYDLGLLRLEEGAARIWLGLGILSLVLGIGLSWSHVRRRISGQSDMDDVSA